MSAVTLALVSLIALILVFGPVIATALGTFLALH